MDQANTASSTHRMDKIVIENRTFLIFEKEKKFLSSTVQKLYIFKQELVWVLSRFYNNGRDRRWVGSKEYRN